MAGDHEVRRQGQITQGPEGPEGRGKEFEAYLKYDGNHRCALSKE